MSETWVEQFARWSNTLNDWTWPWDLPGKPKDWDDLLCYVPYWDDPEQKIRTKHTVISAIDERLEPLISKKEILRWHHLHNLHYSNHRFELYWAAMQCDMFEEFYNAMQAAEKLGYPGGDIWRTVQKPG